MGKSGIHIIDPTVALQHRIPDSDSFISGIEVCSGIGALGEGFAANGIEVRVRNGLRHKFPEFLHHQGFHHTVTGDVGSHEDLNATHEKHQTPSALGAGFPCQPWSKLGDRRQSKDARAGTSRAILRAAFFLRCDTLLLECVPVARQDKDVLKQLREWCRITRFNAGEVTLDLSQVWAAHRLRWWCLLTFPGSTPPQLEPFPRFSAVINIGTTLVTFSLFFLFGLRTMFTNWNRTLRASEVWGMRISNNVVNLGLVLNWKLLKTSLHGWGNQLEPCPCGCRMHPRSTFTWTSWSFDFFGGSIACGNTEVPSFRHVHPWELSLLQGLSPNKVWLPSFKLPLAGLSQMASPLQSGWIMSQLFFVNADLTEPNLVRTPEQPEHVLWDMMSNLFYQREIMFPGVGRTPRVQKITKMLHGVLSTASQGRLVPRGVPDAESIASTLMDSFAQLDNEESPLNFLARSKHVVNRLIHHHSQPFWLQHVRNVERSYRLIVRKDSHLSETTPPRKRIGNCSIRWTTCRSDPSPTQPHRRTGKRLEESLVCNHFGTIQVMLTHSSMTATWPAECQARFKITQKALKDKDREQHGELAHPGGSPDTCSRGQGLGGVSHVRSHGPASEAGVVTHPVVPSETGKGLHPIKAGVAGLHPVATSESIKSRTHAQEQHASEAGSGMHPIQAGIEKRCIRLHLVRKPLMHLTVTNSHPRWDQGCIRPRQG